LALLFEEKIETWGNKVLAITVELQAHHFGVMGHLRSQFCAMPVDLDGEQREHLQIILPYMLGQNLSIMTIKEFPG
jgi:hypothetical protein